MKFICRSILILLLAVSCNKKTEVIVNQDDFQTESVETNVHTLTNDKWNNWLSYYKTTIDSTLNFNNFTLQAIDTIMPMKGSVYGIFDSDFDKIYQPFLIFNSKKDKYIDLDSYHWRIDKSSNDLIYEADQEVNLVDIPNKTVTRIAFLGPSYLVEDAFWQNDSVVVLLQNSYDNVPSINMININTYQQKSYMYNDTLKTKSNYHKHRILSKLKNEYNILFKNVRYL